MCIGDDYPILFRDSDTDVDLVAFDLRFVLNHVPCVNAVFQNPFYRGVGPQAVTEFTGWMLVVEPELLFIHRRIRNTKLIQLFRNADDAHSAQKPLKDVANDFGSRRVDHQMVMILGVFEVSIGRERTDEFALASFAV